MEESRLYRLAIGAKSLGIPSEYVGMGSRQSEECIRNAIERVGFKASNDRRFNGTYIHCHVPSIYVIGAVGMGVVKVGWSEQVAKRARAINQGLPVPSILLGVLLGQAFKVESVIHKEMASWHQRGEWFRLTPRSRAYLAKRLGVVIDDTDADKIGVCDE